MTFLWAAVVFCVIIFIHEFGHFITAKMCGITVHEFSIGMGPKLVGFTKNNTVYNIRLLPIGGFVQLEGENGESDDPNAFGNKSALKRFIVLASGAFMNFVLGFVFFVIIVANSAQLPTQIIDTFTDNSPFEKAGIMSGDKIVKMESENYSTNIICYDDISLFGGLSGYSPCKVTVERDGEKLKFDVTPEFNEKEGRYLYGFRVKTREKNFLTILGSSFEQSVFTVKTVFKSFGMLISGKLSANDVSGPVGIVSEIGKAAKSGVLYVLNLAGLISINLGVVNLFPIPALDGGRILFIIIEKIRKKRLTPEQEGIIHTVGFALLMFLMIAVTFFDVQKLFG